MRSSIKRCSWPLGTCVTHFSSKTENTPVNMLSTRSDFLRKTPVRKQARWKFLLKNSLPVTFLSVEENNLSTCCPPEVTSKTKKHPPEKKRDGQFLLMDNFLLNKFTASYVFDRSVTHACQHVVLKLEQLLSNMFVHQKWLPNKKSTPVRKEARGTFFLNKDCQ